MGKDYRVMYANGPAVPLYESDHPLSVVEWASNNVIAPGELEVYRHAEGDYVRMVDFLSGNRPVFEDKVNHPSHYTSYEGLEIIDLTEQMNFNRGNAVKYVARAGLKDAEKEIEDLEKAVWYLQREIKRVKRTKSL